MVSQSTPNVQAERTRLQDSYLNQRDQERSAAINFIFCRANECHSTTTPANELEPLDVPLVENFYIQLRIYFNLAMLSCPAFVSSKKEGKE